MSIFDFFPKISPTSPPNPSLIPPKPVQSSAQNVYLPAFKVILSTARTLLGSGEVVDRFEGLSEAAQVLYVQLFSRKRYWHYVDEDNLEGKAVNAELIASGFACSMETAFEGPPERLYELLKSLRRPDIDKLAGNAKALLVQLTGEDHSSTPLPLFPKPEKNPLYSLSRDIFTTHLSQALVSMQISTNWTALYEEKPKTILIAYLMELIEEIKKEMEDLRTVWKLKRREMLGEEGEGWVKALIGQGFPILITLKIPEKTEIMRLLAAFDFFHTQNDRNYLEYMRITGAKYPIYTCNSISMGLFPTDPSIWLIYDACLVESMLKSLHMFHLSKEIEGEIGQLISKFALSIFANDNIGQISTFPSFLSHYNGFKCTFEWCNEYSVGWYWVRVAHQCSFLLEKALLWSEAVHLYWNLLARLYYYQRRGYWWERLILDLSYHLSNREDAEIAVKLALADPGVRTGKRITIEKQGNRLGIPVSSFVPTSDAYFSQFSHTNFHLRTITAANKGGNTGPLYVTAQEMTVKVEEYALSWYAEKGWKGFHCENSLFRAIYAIFLWPVLYSSTVPGTFVHNYQKHALDYKFCTFYESRRELFTREFEYLQGCTDLVALFQERYSLYQGYLSSYVDWDMVAGWGIGSLREIIGAIDRKALIGLFSILAQDYKYTNHGLPDLLLWKDTQVLLVEVKSHNDRLADHQKLWIQTLAELGFFVEVLHVLNA